MIRQRKILGYVLLVYNGIALVLVTGLLGQSYSKEDIQVLVVLSVLFCVLFVATYASFHFANGKEWTIPIVKAVAFVHLLNFPIGTAVGGYVLWFYWRYGIGKST